MPLQENKKKRPCALYRLAWLLWLLAKRAASTLAVADDVRRGPAADVAQMAHPPCPSATEHALHMQLLRQRQGQGGLVVRFSPMSFQKQQQQSTTKKKQATRSAYAPIDATYPHFISVTQAEASERKPCRYLDCVAIFCVYFSTGTKKDEVEMK